MAIYETLKSLWVYLTKGALWPPSPTEEQRRRVLAAEALALWEAAGERHALARRAFAQATDPRLVDAAVYEMKAAEAILSFALRQSRENEAYLPAKTEGQARVLLSMSDRVFARPSGAAHTGETGRFQTLPAGRPPEGR